MCICVLENTLCMVIQSILLKNVFLEEKDL